MRIKQTLMKIYIGDKIAEGIPDNLKLFGVANKKNINNWIKKALEQAKNKDVYITHPDGNIYAYYRDKLEYFFS